MASASRFAPSTHFGTHKSPARRLFPAGRAVYLGDLPGWRGAAGVLLGGGGAAQGNVKTHQRAIALHLNGNGVAHVLVLQVTGQVAAA